MPIATAADVNVFIDNLCQMYFRQLGLTGENYGTGGAAGTYSPGMSVGAYSSALALQTALLATVDPDVVGALQGGVTNMVKSTNALSIMIAEAGTFLNNLKVHLRSLPPAGVTINSIDDYLTYLNVGAGGPWSALQHPAWYAIYQAFANVLPSTYNLYFPVLQGGSYLGTTYTVGLGELSGSTFTAGFAVDTTKYSGGFPYLNVASVTGSDLVTVTGTSVSYSGGALHITTGSTWTVTISATGTDLLVPGGTQPAPANSLIAAVTNITHGSGISAITCYAEAHPPTSRLAVP